MIYRPVPITEAKARAIDAVLKAKILKEKKNAVHAALPSFCLGHGREEAIQKRIVDLEDERAMLFAQLKRNLSRASSPAQALPQPAALPASKQTESIAS